jgi:hypothetical protein
MPNTERLGAMQAEHASRLESMLGAFHQALGGLAAAHAAPRKRTLVRGPDGRATHAIDEIMLPAPQQRQ